MIEITTQFIPKIEIGLQNQEAIIKNLETQIGQMKFEKDHQGP